MIVKFGSKPTRSAAVGPAEQVAGEHAGPGGLGVDAQPALMRRVRADVQVLGVQVLLGAVGHEAGAKLVVVRLADRPVDLAPPDLVAAGRLVDDELVLRRATGVLAGADDQRAVGGDEALAGADRVLDELGRRAVDPQAATQRRANAAGAGCRGVVGAGGMRGGHQASDSLGAGDHITDRPAARDAGPKGTAGVGFHSRVGRDCTTFDRCRQVARRWRERLRLGTCARARGPGPRLDVRAASPVASPHN